MWITSEAERGIGLHSRAEFIGFVSSLPGRIETKPVNSALAFGNIFHHGSGFAGKWDSLTAHQISGFRVRIRNSFSDSISHINLAHFASSRSTPGRDSNGGRGLKDKERPKSHMNR